LLDASPQVFRDVWGPKIVVRLKPKSLGPSQRAIASEPGAQFGPAEIPPDALAWVGLGEADFEGALDRRQTEKFLSLRVGKPGNARHAGQIGVIERSFKYRAIKRLAHEEVRAVVVQVTLFKGTANHTVRLDLRHEIDKVLFELRKAHGDLAISRIHEGEVLSWDTCFFERGSCFSGTSWVGMRPRQVDLALALKKPMDRPSDGNFVIWVGHAK
jgi:hypothetical protein